MCNSTAASNNPVILDDAHLPPQHARRNHTLGVAAGAVGGLGTAFVHPELIIAGLVDALTQSTMLVAVVTIASNALRFIGGLVFLFVLEWHLALVTAIVVPVLMLLMHRLVSRLRPLSREGMEQEAQVSQKLQIGRASCRERV